MKEKQFISVIVAFVVIVLFYSFFGGGQQQKKRGVYRLGEEIFPGLGKVEKLTLAQGDKTVELKRDVKEGWQVASRENFPADGEAVAALLGTLKGIKADQLVYWDDSDLESYGLDAGQRIEISCEDDKGREYKLQVGASHFSAGKQAGRYYATLENESLFLSGLPGKNLHVFHSVWLRKFLPDYSRIVSVSYHSGQQLLWQCGRKSLQQEFTFDYPSQFSKLSKAEVHDFLSNVFQIRYMDAAPADADISTPLLADELRVTDVLGNVYTLRLLTIDKQRKKIRCTLSIKTSGLEKDLKQKHFENELLGWHFFVSLRFLKELRVSH